MAWLRWPGSRGGLQQGWSRCRARDGVAGARPRVASQNQRMGAGKDERVAREEVFHEPPRGCRRRR